MKDMLILSTRESINKIWFSFINANINQNQIFHYQLYLVLNINNDNFISKIYKYIGPMVIKNISF